MSLLHSLTQHTIPEGTHSTRFLNYSWTSEVTRNSTKHIKCPAPTHKIAPIYPTDHPHNTQTNKNPKHTLNQTTYYNHNNQQQFQHSQEYPNYHPNTPPKTPNPTIKSRPTSRPELSKTLRSAHRIYPNNIHLHLRPLTLTTNYNAQ